MLPRGIHSQLGTGNFWKYELDAVGDDAKKICRFSAEACFEEYRRKQDPELLWLSDLWWPWLTLIWLWPWSDLEKTVNNNTITYFPLNGVWLLWGGFHDEPCCKFGPKMLKRIGKGRSEWRHLKCIVSQLNDVKSFAVSQCLQFCRKIQDVCIVLKQPVSLEATCRFSQGIYDNIRGEIEFFDIHATGQQICWKVFWKFPLVSIRNSASPIVWVQTCIFRHKRLCFPNDRRHPLSMKQLILPSKSIRSALVTGLCSLRIL